MSPNIRPPCTRLYEKCIPIFRLLWTSHMIQFPCASQQQLQAGGRSADTGQAMVAYE